MKYALVSVIVETATIGGVKGFDPFCDFSALLTGEVSKLRPKAS